MNTIENKWMRAAVPALLIHCSIGTVYCWSLLKGGIAEYIGRPLPEVEWAFSLAIFFLGMSAAFAGKIVEKDIHKASLIAAVCFATGIAVAGFGLAKVIASPIIQMLLGATNADGTLVDPTRL